jgi:hypothetical protein
MDANIKIEKLFLEDGRRAEKRIIESKNANGDIERVIELRVEDERPLKLQQRVVEKSKPVIFERKIEVIDPASGNVIEEKVESLNPQSSADSVQSLGCDSGHAKHASRDEIVQAVLSALKDGRGGKEARKPKVQSLGLAEEFEKMNTPQKDGMSLTDKILLVVIAVQVVGLAYIIFFM